MLNTELEPIIIIVLLVLNCQIAVNIHALCSRCHYSYSNLSVGMVTLKPLLTLYLTLSSCALVYSTEPYKSMFTLDYKKVAGNTEQWNLLSPWYCIAVNFRGYIIRLPWMWWVKNWVADYNFITCTACISCVPVNHAKRFSQGKVSSRSTCPQILLNFRLYCPYHAHTIYFLKGTTSNF